MLFFVGDDRQRIYDNTQGLVAVRTVAPSSHERILPFHYRVAPEICQVADRILVPQGGESLASTAHYNGPTPARITISRQSLAKERQLEITVDKLKEQIRVYGDLIRQGDRIGVIVALKDDRDAVFNRFENDPILNGKSKSN